MARIRRSVLGSDEVEEEEVEEDRKEGEEEEVEEVVWFRQDGFKHTLLRNNFGIPAESSVNSPSSNLICCNALLIATRFTLATYLLVPPVLITGPFNGVSRHFVDGVTPNSLTISNTINKNPQIRVKKIAVKKRSVLLFVCFLEVWVAEGG